MTQAEADLLEAARTHWITAKYNHLIAAVNAEHEHWHPEFNADGTRRMKRLDPIRRIERLESALLAIRQWDALDSKVVGEDGRFWKRVIDHALDPAFDCE